MMIILLKDNLITEALSTNKPKSEVAKIAEKLNYSFDTMIEVPEDFEVRIGADINEYDESLKYKSEEQRILEGFIPVPEGFEIKDGEVQEIKPPEKTPEEIKIEQAEENRLRILDEAQAEAEELLQRTLRSMAIEKLVEEK